MKSQNEANVFQIRMNEERSQDEIELIQSMKSLENYLRLIGKAIQPHVDSENNNDETSTLKSPAKLHLVK